MVLLPTSSKWMGPYPVLCKISPVSYEVDMYDHNKRKRIFHVNMLRKWHSSVAANLWAEGEAPGPDPDGIVLWRLLSHRNRQRTSMGSCRVCLRSTVMCCVCFCLITKSSKTCEPYSPCPSAIHSVLEYNVDIVVV